MSCPFCFLFKEPIVDREILSGNPVAVAWLHESQAHRGHAVVAARRHVQNLSELDDHEAADFLSLARDVETAVLAETGAERAVLMKLGLQVPHLHLHIYPFSREATRDEVMRVIDGEVTDHSRPEEQRQFASRVRSRVAEGERR